MTTVGLVAGLDDSGGRDDRKGTDGVSTSGVTANSSYFDRGTFWVLPLTCFYVPKSARVYLFPQSVKINYFCSAPLVLTPFVRNQTSGATRCLILVETLDASRMQERSRTSRLVLFEASCDIVAHRFFNLRCI